MTDTITLTDASERLGVHYMTAYRYVRTGRLAAHKAGGQWRVTTDDLEHFTTDETPRAPRAEVLPPLIAERLVAGDENGTYQLLEDAMAAGATADEVYLDLIGPAMAAVGERWHAGELTIADEHVASSTALRVVSRLGSRVAARGRSRGTILLASVAGDYHYLPTAMIRDLLRFRGFDVVDLGANTPASSIIDRANTIGDDLLAIGLASTTPGAEDVAQATLTALDDALDIPVVLGGGAFADTDQIRSLGNCVPSQSARHALEIFDDIHAEARAR